MRKFTTAVLLVGILVSCNNQKTGTKPLAEKSDTTPVKVLGIYKVKEWKLDSVYRVIKDTFRLSGIDTAGGKAKMTWVKDTIYFIPIITDSVKKEGGWYGIPAKHVQEIKVIPLIAK